MIHRGAITLVSSDENDENDISMTDDSHKRTRGGMTAKRRKGRKRGRKKRTEDSDEQFEGHDNVNNNKPSMTRTSKIKRKRSKHHNNDNNDNNNNESISLISDIDGQQHERERELLTGETFEDLKRKALKTGHNEEIYGDDSVFTTDPLISDITNKMLQIRQISINRRMETPEHTTAAISTGLNMLVQAIEEMNNDNNNKTNKLSVRNGHHQRKHHNHLNHHKHHPKGASLKIKISRRKGGELYVVDNSKENSLSNNGTQKIKEILKTKYHNFFKLNNKASFLKKAKAFNNNGDNSDLEKGLNKLSQQLKDEYNKGLLQVFKTMTAKSSKDKFESIQNKSSISMTNKKREYFQIFDEIVKQHLLSQMDTVLKSYKIKQAVGLLCAIMDHLFSYSMYKYLCNIIKDEDDDNDKNHNDDDDKKEDGNIKLEKPSIKSEQYVETKGNKLFVEIINKEDELKSIENTYISWLFEYWRKLLLQSQEPIKCLLRAYLVNSEPNPFKNRLYVMVTQTPHQPLTTVLPSLSSSTSLTSPIKTENKDDKKIKKETTPKVDNNNNFARKPTQSMSINGTTSTSSSSVNTNIASSSVCGQTFSTGIECSNHHKKQCKDCDHRTVTIKSNQ